MKKSLLRAALLALLPFCMAGSAVVLTTVPAAAKDDQPKISRSISKFVAAIQKANDAKDWPTMVSNANQALATPDITDYDKYILQRYLGLAYLNLGDHAAATDAVVNAVLNPAAPADERRQLMHPAMALENEASNYAKVLELGQLAVSMGGADDTTYGEMCTAAYNLKDNAHAIEYAKKSVELAQAAGKLPVYAVYQVLVVSQDAAKDRAGAIKTLELMASDYGKPEDWRYLLDLSMEQLPPGNKNAAVLSIYRLRLTAGAKSEGADFLAMVDAAQFLRSPGDVKRAIEAAIAAGALALAKATPFLNKANADARRDEPILAQAEAAAAKGSSKEEAMVAEAYFGYGRYNDVVRVATHAANRGGPGAAEARLLLGMAQAMLGDETTAAQTFDAVTGDGAIVRTAQLWKIYVTRKYGRPAAAAPAAPAAPESH